MGNDANGRASGGLPFGTRMGRYTLLRRLAVGGMAELYVARQTGIEGFEKIVALKRVLPHLAEDPHFVQMFLSEARIAAALDHPNIIHVTDIGEADGEYFFAMEYVHGANLLQVLRQGDTAPLPLACALTIVVGVAAALHHAHEQLGPDGRPQGLVHRDVSPSNVMIAHTGAVKLADFGIVRAAAKTSTTEGHTKGKAGYMSPEQCRGDILDRRSDVFALGIVLYEVTTGVRAFYAANDYAILGRTARADYIAPAEVSPDYPPQLAEIVARALAKEPHHRFETAEAMQLQLEDFAQTQGLRLSAVELSRHMNSAFGSPAHPHTGLGSMPVQGPPSVPSPAAAPTARLPWLLAGAGLATSVAVTLALWPRPEAESTPEPSPTSDLAPAVVGTAAPDGVAVRGEPAPQTTPDRDVPPAIDDTQPVDGEPPAGSEGPAASVGEQPQAEATPARPRTHNRRRRKTSPKPKPDRNSLYPPGVRP